jgi:hypothetical protein
MSPAPERARWPRWIMCQSLAVPFVAEYWHIGAITIRFPRRRSPIRSGSNRRLIKCSSNPVAAVVMDDFDLVPGWVRYKEELRQEPPLIIELLHWCWSKTHWFEARVLGLKAMRRANETVAATSAISCPLAKGAE